MSIEKFKKSRTLSRKSFGFKRGSERWVAVYVDFGAAKCHWFILVTNIELWNIFHKLVVYTNSILKIFTDSVKHMANRSVCQWYGRWHASKDVS